MSRCWTGDELDERLSEAEDMLRRLCDEIERISEDHGLNHETMEGLAEEARAFLGHAGEDI